MSGSRDVVALGAALLIVFKGIAYALSLGSFRGGPTFPAMFLGAAAGILASHLPGFAITPAVAVGIGAGTVSMLRLPLSAVVIATVLTTGSGGGAEPLIIVGVVVAYLITLLIEAPRPAEPTAGDEGAAAANPAPESARRPERQLPWPRPMPQHDDTPGAYNMPISTGQEIPGMVVREGLGVCFGLVVRSMGFTKSFTASFKALQQGEVKEYTQLLEDSRRHAVDRMIDNARLLGADGVIAMRFDSSEIGQSLTEIVAYGTAVRLERVA